MHYTHFVGIDISKDTLDAALYPSKDKNQDYLHFANTVKGLSEMVSWLKSKDINFDELLICAEHTGIYSNTLIAFCDKSGLALSLNSPLDIKRSMGLTRGKNDKVDSFRIAYYAYSRLDRIKLYEKPSDTIRDLQILLTERKQYVKQRISLVNMHSEMKKYETDLAKSRNETAINNINKLICSVESQMLSIIAKDQRVKHNYELVKSVKGIGPVNAINTIVYTNNFKSFDSPRKYACFIGVAPFDHSSGTSVKGKTQVSKYCRTQQKAELSMAARCAIIHDPVLKEYYQRKMKEKGGGRDAYGIVLNAVKFKLILRIFAVVKSGVPYST